MKIKTTLLVLLVGSFLFCACQTPKPAVTTALVLATEPSHNVTQEPTSTPVSTLLSIPTQTAMMTPALTTNVGNIEILTTTDLNIFFPYALKKQRGDRFENSGGYFTIVDKGKTVTISDGVKTDIGYTFTINGSEAFATEGTLVNLYLGNYLSDVVEITYNPKTSSFVWRYDQKLNGYLRPVLSIRVVLYANGKTLALESTFLGKNKGKETPPDWCLYVANMSPDKLNGYTTPEGETYLWGKQPDGSILCPMVKLS